MKRTLKEVIAWLEAAALLKDTFCHQLSLDTVFCDITFDNRTAGKDSLFVCKGARFREEYLHKAFGSGALLYVADHTVCQTLPHLIVSDIRLAMSRLAALFFEEEAKDVYKIGITGTKGKTTVSVLLHAVLDRYCAEQYSSSTALVSSLRVYDGIVDKPSTLTTPEAIEFFRHLANAGRASLPYAICEISSQALKYHRVRDVIFDLAIFLNIGTDHISEIEHPDFEDYFSSKLMIFQSAGIACLNSGADHFDRIRAEAERAGCRVCSFGQKDDDMLQLISSRREGDYQTLTVVYQSQIECYRLPMFGQHNAENALAVILAAKLCGIPDTVIYQGLMATQVDGRGKELVSCDGKVRVIVDYAHNQMSLEALYRYVEGEYPDYRVITLFGCPGGKAENRRQDMGRTAARHSDLVILTEDDPDTEPLEEILQTIASFVQEEGTPYFMCSDRGKAISMAFSHLFEKTVLLLCGKGAETTQKRQNGAEPYETDEYFARQGIEQYDTLVLPITS
ncbi:MAG: UDP-N-acetylmuramyl-tripeptide synthetase [Clostridia bacterium]|nr:UDP-N-acetylmuramyl-tripeptide synthetase [Clostridia bacterium]